jgi:chromosome segregation ATPase
MRKEERHALYISLNRITLEVIESDYDEVMDQDEDNSREIDATKEELAIENAKKHKSGRKIGALEKKIENLETKGRRLELLRLGCHILIESHSY